MAVAAAEAVAEADAEATAAAVAVADAEALAPAEAVACSMANNVLSWLLLFQDFVLTCLESCSFLLVYIVCATALFLRDTEKSPDVTWHDTRLGYAW